MDDILQTLFKIENEIKQLGNEILELTKESVKENLELSQEAIEEKEKKWAIEREALEIVIEVLEMKISQEAYRKFKEEINEISDSEEEFTDAETKWSLGETIVIDNQKIKQDFIIHQKVNSKEESSKISEAESLNDILQSLFEVENNINEIKKEIVEHDKVFNKCKTMKQKEKRWLIEKQTLEKKKELLELKLQEQNYRTLIFNDNNTDGNSDNQAGAILKKSNEAIKENKAKEDEANEEVKEEATEVVIIEEAVEETIEVAVEVIEEEPIEEIKEAVNLINFGPPEGLWACRSCTLLNYLVNDICFACKTSRNVTENRRVLEILDEAASYNENNLENEDLWECYRCTYVNSTEVGICIICGSGKKENTEKLDKAAFNENNLENEDLWECHHCTYINSAEVDICIICDLDKKENTKKKLENREKLNEAAAYSESEDSWKCNKCTLLNFISSTECEVCGTKKEENMRKRENKEKLMAENKTYLELLSLNSYHFADVIENCEVFECPVCIMDCPIGQGVTLRECLHQFCKDCLAHTVEFSEEAEIKCPYIDKNYACNVTLQDREVKALVTTDIYEKYLARSVKQAESQIDNTFHCKTPDCRGWCIVEDNVNFFLCPVCDENSCLTCQAIHDGMDCRQYQEELKTLSETDENARKTHNYLQSMLERGEGLHCPTCKIIILKISGCDGLTCTMCKTEICWVTRGPRWGPGGKGDTTGGCRCRFNGVKCHPACNNCH